ncbi:MAG: cupredoxin domain-containing protein [Vibrio sp.]
MKKQLLIGVMIGLTSLACYGQAMPKIHLSVTDKQCEPMALNVPAGKVQFIIKNNSMRALEWEILNGVMVVAERENIAPGFYQKMTVNLEPGEYQTTCGLLTNPHGSLTVSGAHDYHVKAQDLVLIAAEYKFYMIVKTRQLQTWLQQGGTSVPKEIQSAYYSISSMIPAYGNRTPEDYLSPLALPQLKQQVTDWQTLVRNSTLSLAQLNAQIIDLLSHPISHDAQWQGIDANIAKWVDIVMPLAKKIDAASAQTLSSELKQWQEKHSLKPRQALHKDVMQWVERIQQENRS